MLAIVGTVPSLEFSFTMGKLTLKEDRITIDGKPVAINRGTPALIAAAIKTAEFLGSVAPIGILVGDIGHGKGSRELYSYLVDNLQSIASNTLVFHYLQPIVHWHNRLQKVLESIQPRPTLIADAGFMYVAKMSGHAQMYDLFTPDIGELAFLADENAPHPFYTRGFILHEQNNAAELIQMAYQHGNAARYLLVKGEKDYVADATGIHASIDNPSVEVLEAMGGTGDTITGIVSVLIDAGYPIPQACELAASANRLSGSFACPNPATQVMEIVRYIPSALQDILGEKQAFSKSNEKT